MKIPESIIICEVGLRDGLQNEKTQLTTQQKVSTVNAVSEAGFQVIEVGSFVSPNAVPQMADTDEVFTQITKKKNVEYRALIANARGLERAIACGCRKVKLNVSASTAHNLANLNCTPEETVSKFNEIVLQAKEFGVHVSGSISMAFGSPWDSEIPLDRVKRIIESYMAVGVEEISLSDASGMAYPTQVADMCEAVKKEYPQVVWWLHFHNTRGLGMANILASMEAGFNRFDTSFAGVGGCPFVPGAAGNVATEDVLHMCEEMEISTGIDIDKSMAVSRQIVSYIGHNTDSYLLRAGKSKDLIRELPTGQTKYQKK